MSTNMTATGQKVLQAKSSALIASPGTSPKTASTSMTKVEKKIPKIDVAVAKYNKDALKLQVGQNNPKATVESPEMVAAATALNEALLKIRVLEYRFKEETEEKMRYQKQFTEAAIEALRAKKENKALAKTVAGQSLAIEDIHSEVETYFKESAEGYKRREASHEAYAAELEELLEVQRYDKLAAADRIQCLKLDAVE